MKMKLAPWLAAFQRLVRRANYIPYRVDCNSFFCEERGESFLKIFRTLVLNYRAFEVNRIGPSKPAGRAWTLSMS